MDTAPAHPARVGELAPRHRGRVAEILRATGVFRDEEVDVALELFDESFAPRANDECFPPSGGKHPPYEPADGGRQYPSELVSPAGSTYAFLGAFTPEDELVGYACYGPTPETDRTWDLYWIATDPATHGTGGGTRLLTEVERRLEGLNARMLVVETSSRSEYAPTRAFYERRGYAEAARVREFYAPGDDRIIYTKKFNRKPGSPTGRGAVQQ